jgi:hypothetical protein
MGLKYDDLLMEEREDVQKVRFPGSETAIGESRDGGGGGG